MRNKRVYPFTMIIILALAGCSQPATKADVGTVVGGVGGGIIGSQIGGGHGRTVAIIGGTILGAIIGREIGASIDRTDELKAQQALEDNRTGETSTWKNPDENKQVAVTPTKTYQRSDGRYCREYTTEVVVGGKTEIAYGTACRQPDGSWEIVK